MTVLGVFFLDCDEKGKQCYFTLTSPISFGSWFLVDGNSEARAKDTGDWECNGRGGGRGASGKDPNGGRENL